MRVISIFLMTLVVALAVLVRCYEGANLRIALPDDEEEFRSRHHYRDYGVIRRRAVRGDDAFDDYGHLRFGRSDD